MEMNGLDSSSPGIELPVLIRQAADTQCYYTKRETRDRKRVTYLSEDGRTAVRNLFAKYHSCGCVKLFAVHLMEQSYYNMLNVM